MKNKIFNAIQKGLTNALIFDDNDSSISYRKSNINNETDIPKVSLDELYEIFKNSPEDIFDYNTLGCVSLILNDNQEISLSNYTDFSNVAFLKIFNDELENTGNEIIIGCDNNHYANIHVGSPWQYGSKQILPDEYLVVCNNCNNVYNDFDGYKKCQMIQDTVNKKDSHMNHVHAIDFCNKKTVLNYKGYLPSIGQLNFILKYLDMINYIFNYIGYASLYLNSDSWWSSSEYSCNDVWYLNNSKIRYDTKNQIYCVLPLFHPLKNK